MGQSQNKSVQYVNSEALRFIQEAQEALNTTAIEEVKSKDDDRLQMLEAKLLKLQEDLDTTKNQLRTQEKKVMPTCPICQSAVLGS